MTSSEIIKRARSLADIPNSLYITHDDEKSSLFESYKDIYSKITDSSDDYFIKESILDPVVASKIGDTEWEVEIPSDVYKLRFLDYYDSGRWIAMTKFATANRNKSFSTPQYRWRGSKLWITGQLPSKIRIDYYPPPIVPALPDLSYNYGLSLSAPDKMLVSSPYFTSIANPNNAYDTDYLLYVNNGLQIKVESTVLQTTSTLYTSATAITNLQYYMGSVYFLTGGNLYKATSNLVSTITPTQIIASVDTFNISKNKIYYTSGGQTYSAALDGTNPQVVYAYATTCFNKLDSGDNLYLNAGVIYRNDVSLGISATYLSTDGVYIYYLDSAEVLHKYLSITDDVILATNVQIMSGYSNNFIALITDNWSIKAISSEEDTEFDYPLNEAWELMAYQCAIDFKRKNNGDVTLLQTRLSEVYGRFTDVLVRDAYQPERMAPQTPFSY